MAKAGNKRVHKKPSRRTTAAAAGKDTRHRRYRAPRPTSNATAIAAPAATRPDAATATAADRVAASNLTLHELFARQTRTMLDRADLSDEQKQSVLVAMSCPCCGAGGFSFTAKLKRGR